MKESVMTDILSIRQRGIGGTGTRSRTRINAARAALVLAALVLIVAAAVAASGRLALARPAISAEEIGKAHLLWLADEHTYAAVGSASTAHLVWLRGEHEAYGTDARPTVDSRWQSYRGFRLEEEGYNR
jgi:hypothetical protein